MDTQVTCWARPLSWSRLSRPWGYTGHAGSLLSHLRKRAVSASPALFYITSETLSKIMCCLFVVCGMVHIGGQSMTLE